ncbi:hypothetical protein HDV02_006556 [Globomyces sp. JEL0801]|nr:hypothetical protein HDV02_006556 [Globomyces sp. JEL0801]
MNSIKKVSKKPQRKTPHSVIEKRRRESINQCLATLKELVPSCAIEDALPKLAVLQKTVEYVIEMQSMLREPRIQTDEGVNFNVQLVKFNLIDNHSIPSSPSSECSTITNSPTQKTAHFPEPERKISISSLLN